MDETIDERELGAEEDGNEFVESERRFRGRGRGDFCLTCENWLIVSSEVFRLAEVESTRGTGLGGEAGEGFVETTWGGDEAWARLKNSSMVRVRPIGIGGEDGGSASFLGVAYGGFEMG